MLSLQHSFIKYEGLTPVLYSDIGNFCIFPINFTIAIPYMIWPIYTLHKVTLKIDSPTLSDNHTLCVPLKFIYQYTIKDLCHTLNTTTYPYTLYKQLSQDHPLNINNIYTEDLFSHCLDECHIYTSLSIVINFQSL